MLESLIVHIGTSRTATTLHQYFVFPKHSGLAFLGKPAPNTQIWRANWTMSRGHERFFDPQEIAEIFGSFHAERGANLPLLLSDEAFWGGGAVPLPMMHERLRQIARRTKIIMTLRRQADVVRSVVMRDIINPFRAITASQLYRYEHNQHFCRSTYMGNMFYDSDVALIRRLFGPENVLVLLYEEFARDRPIYVKRLSSFLGIDGGEMSRLFEAVGDKVNTGASVDEASFISFRVKAFRMGRKRKLDRLGGAIVGALGIKGDAHKTVDRIERDAREIYAESNRKLATMVEYDLAAYGYPM